VGGAVGDAIPLALGLAARVHPGAASAAVDVTQGRCRWAPNPAEQGDAAAVRLAAEALPKILQSEDAREDMMSLMQKREGVFKGN
jgi:hypothetical protein